jgi:hypothetical protein
MIIQLYLPYRMRVINNIQDAIDFGSTCLRAYKPTKQAKAVFSRENDFHAPHWAITTDAMHRTLSYIFNILHHSCYMLCVPTTAPTGAGAPTIVKLESTTTPPFFKERLDEELGKLSQNTTITEQQRNTIRKFAANREKMRILQCIVKQIKAESTTSVEYEDLFTSLSTSLPSGLFILNLTDAVILHKDGYNPFPVFRGETPEVLDGDFIPSREKPFLPIFSLSGQVNYLDIPIPNYDDVSYALGKAQYDIGSFTTGWAQKQLAKAVFRGGPSGCGTTVRTNQRIRLASLKSPLLDAGIVGTSSKGSIDSNSIRFDPVHGLSMMNTGIRPVQRLSYQEQSHYKYIVHIDGNVNAYRLLSTMATGSLVLRVKSPYTSWIDRFIEAGVHFVEVKQDLSNLIEKIQYCVEHDDECRLVAERGLAFAQQALTREFVEGTIKERMSSTIGSSKVREKVAKELIAEPEPPNEAKEANDDSFYIKAPNETRCRTGYLQDKKDKSKCVKKTVQIPIKPTEAERPVQQPIGNENTYTKALGEKCRSGYLQDKKDKTKCVKKAPIGAPEPLVKAVPNPVVKAPEPVVKAPEPVVKVTKPITVPEFYIKAQGETRCRTGFLQDKKDKTKCVSKTQVVAPVTKKAISREASPKTLKAVSREATLKPKAVPREPSPKMKAVSPDPYTTVPNGTAPEIRKKCDTIKHKIRDLLR